MMDATAHCFYCESGTHVRPRKRQCATDLCDCCRKPVARHVVSARGWCDNCELEFSVVRLAARRVLRAHRRVIAKRLYV